MATVELPPVSYSFLFFLDQRQERLEYLFFQHVAGKEPSLALPDC